MFKNSHISVYLRKIYMLISKEMKMNDLYITGRHFQYKTDSQFF